MEKYIAFFDSLVNAFLPDRNEKAELYQLVKSYQL